MVAGIFVLPVFILVALALGALVYYICYKAAINRKLKAEESGVHVPMASTESVFKVVVMIGVFVMYCSLNSKIMNLQQELQNTTNRLYDEMMVLQYELGEMQEKAKKEASVISEIYYDFGEIDTENHVVEMKFWVFPKSYSAETEVVLNYWGENILLTNDGNGRFSGSQTVPLYEEVWDEGMICVTENGVTKTEVWEEAPKGSMLFECLPKLILMESTFGSEERKGKISVEGEMYLVPSDKNAAPFQAMMFYVRKGQEVLEEIPLNDGHISFNLSYEVEKGESIDMYVTGVDEYGYLHETCVYEWSNNEMSADLSHGTSVETLGKMYRIYTPDGTMLIQ